MAEVEAAKTHSRTQGHRRKKRVGIRIDMTPMVDVAFLLLIFFMVTTVFRAPQTMEINLPPSDQRIDVGESNLLILYVTETSGLYWGVGFDKPASTGMKELPELLTARLRENPELITLVKLDRKARYHMMVDLLDQLNLANVTRFSVAVLDDADRERLAAL
jgi:biopolymer transport protein ExbD